MGQATCRHTRAGLQSGNKNSGTNNNNHAATSSTEESPKWNFNHPLRCVKVSSSSLSPSEDIQVGSQLSCLKCLAPDVSFKSDRFAENTEKFNIGSTGLTESRDSLDNVWWSVKRVQLECQTQLIDIDKKIDDNLEVESVESSRGVSSVGTSAADILQIEKPSLRRTVWKPYQKVELIIDETKFTIYKVKISKPVHHLSTSNVADGTEVSNNYVASPPEKKCSKDDNDISLVPPVSKNGQLSKQGGLKIFRRSTLQKRTPLSRTSRVESSTDEDAIDAVDLRALDSTPSGDVSEACEAASLRLRSILKRLRLGEVSSDILQRNLQFAVQVLEAVYTDDRVVVSEDEQSPTSAASAVPATPSTVAPCDVSSEKNSISGTAVGHKSDSTCAAVRPSIITTTTTTTTSTTRASATSRTSFSSSSSKLWKVKRKTADDEDDLSEVQPDAVPPEVREWLASTFTRQLSARKKRTDEKPRFRTVAHAIRAGIFVERIYRRMSSTSMPQFPPQVVTLLKNLDDWSFDVFAVNDVSVGQPVRYIGFDLLNRYGIIHKFKISATVLESFLCNIEQGYCRYKNPYHNNIHAADITQTVHFMLCQLGLMNWLTDLEVFATLIAAIIHDYEHTGTTNNFHVMSGSDTALLYNDRAVLENHHCSAAFRLIREDENNIVNNLSREEFREFRNLVIDMVLATDMSYHFQQIKIMKNLLLLPDSNIDKSKALSLVLHCCDISHPSKNWNLHHRWTELLIEEFFRQGDKEKDLGIPFSPLCDRNNTLVAESQIGFIDFIVEPSMHVCGDMLEKISLAMQSSKTLDGSITEESFDQPNFPTGQNKNKARFQRSVGSSGSVNSTKSSDDSTPNSPRGTQSPTQLDFKRPWVQCLNDNKVKWRERATKDAELRAANLKGKSDLLIADESKSEITSVS